MSFLKYPVEVFVIDKYPRLFHHGYMMQSFQRGAITPLLLAIVVAIGAIIGGGTVALQTVEVDVPFTSSFSQLFSQRASEKDFEFLEDKTIRKHFAAQSNVRSIRTITYSGESKEQDALYSEFIEKNGTASFRTWQVSNGTSINELISTDSVVYVKDTSDNTWWKQLIQDESQDSNQIQPKDFKAEYLDKQTLIYTPTNEEACGDMTCYVYEETNPNSISAKRTFWFDKRKKLLRKEHVGFGELITVIEYEYDNLSIEAPSPTKDVPEGEDIYAYFSSGSMSGLGEPLDVAGQVIDRFEQQFQDKLQQQLEERFQQQLEDRFQNQLEERLQERLNSRFTAPGIETEFDSILDETVTSEEEIVPSPTVTEAEEDAQ
ncbi:hypothetical protein ACFL1P_01590 [Patescibacteria group bacterium]